MSDTVVSGRKYRVLIDKDNDAWQVYSFWSQASDCTLTSGETVQHAIDNISSKVTGIIENNESDATDKVPSSKLFHDTVNSMKSSFQAGVDKVYNAAKNNGVTPSASSPDAIVTAINNIRSGGNVPGWAMLSGYNGYAGKNLVSGTMAVRSSYTDCVSWARGSGTTYVRIPQGGYVNNTGVGYPEIQIHDNLYGQGEYNNNYSNGYNSGYGNGQYSVRTGGGKDRGDNGSNKGGRADMASESIWIPRCVAAIVMMNGTGNGEYPPAIFLSSGSLLTQRIFGDQDCTVFVIVNCTSAQTATLRGAYHGDPVYFLTTIGEY